MPAPTVVCIPTYNERDNAPKICREILAMRLDADVVFLDDNSPDGTGAALDEIAATEPRLRVIHRAGKLGIGSAHLEFAAWAYDKGYRRLLTMDSDFTHQPRSIPDFLAAAENADVVVGSRYLRADSLDDWNVYRWLLTRVAHLLTVVFLGMPYDATGAFRLYRLDRLPRALFGLIRSKDYSFFYESLYIVHANGFKIVEVPITLPIRTFGTSKMELADIVKGVTRLFRLWSERMRDPKRFLIPKA